MTSWWSDHPDLEGVARRGRKELHEDATSAERDTELLRKRRRHLIDVCYEWMSRGDLVTISAADYEFEGRLVAAVNDVVVVATKTFEVAVNLDLAQFVRSDRKGAFAGATGDRSVSSFRAALGRAEIEQGRLRLVGRNRAFDVTGVIDASTEDHVLVRGGQGAEWALPRRQVAFAIAEGSTRR